MRDRMSGGASFLLCPSLSFSIFKIPRIFTSQLLVLRRCSWGESSRPVFEALGADFMLDTINKVDGLLELGVNVTIYSSHTHTLFGATSMEIDDMDSVVQPYEAASREIPKDASMAAQLGKAFVIAHNYTKAIEQYERALENTDDILGKLTLTYDVADLFFKLRNYEQAKVVLNGLLGKTDVNIEVEEMKDTTILLLCLKGSLLLSKVQQLLGKRGTMAEEGRQSTDSKYLPQYKVMFGAKNIQNWLIREQHGQHTHAIREQRNVAADIYFHFSQLDLICCTTGIEVWVQKLKGLGLASFNVAKRTPLYCGDSQRLLSRSAKRQPLWSVKVIEPDHW